MKQGLLHVRKRDHRLVKFDNTKITDAIFKAIDAVGMGERIIAEELSKVVEVYLEEYFVDQIPTIEDIQDIVEKVLIETNHPEAAKAFILYREERSRMRAGIKVRDTSWLGSNYGAPFVSRAGAPSGVGLKPWDKTSIVSALIVETGLDESIAAQVASRVEDRIFKSDMSVLSTSLIRELVDNELFDLGLSEQVANQRLLGLPKFDVNQWVNNKEKNSPRQLQATIAQRILRDYAIEAIYEGDVCDALLKQLIEIQDLGDFNKANKASLCLNNLFENGLNLPSLKTHSNKAKHLDTAIHHSHIWLDTMQGLFSEGLTLIAVNTSFAPFCAGMSQVQLRQAAQKIVFSLAYNSTVQHLSDGVVLQLDLRTKDEASLQLATAISQMWAEGDKNGSAFQSPALQFLIDDALITDRDGGQHLFEQIKSIHTVSAQGLRNVTIVKGPEEDNVILQGVKIDLNNIGFACGKGEWTQFLNEVQDAVFSSTQSFLQKQVYLNKQGVEDFDVIKSAMTHAALNIELCGLNESVSHVVGMNNSQPGYEDMVCHLLDSIQKTIRDIRDAQKVNINLVFNPCAEEGADISVGQQLSLEPDSLLKSSLGECAMLPSVLSYYDDVSLSLSASSLNYETFINLIKTSFTQSNVRALKVS